MASQGVIAGFVFWEALVMSIRLQLTAPLSGIGNAH
jgi:hypothetical protein